MNPLSTFSYHRRHKGRAALLVSLCILITAGIYLLGALLWTVYIEQGRANFMFLSRFSVVTPQYDQDGPDPAMIAHIRGNPDVAQVIPTKSIWIELPGVMSGSSNGFRLFGVNTDDLPNIMERCGATLQQGQLVEPQSNGLMLSEEVAASLNLQLGDTIAASKNADLFGSIVTPLEVVGIMKSDVRLAIVSLEFLNNHQAYNQFSLQYLVVPHENRAIPVDAFLRNEIQSSRADVQTLSTLNEIIVNEYQDSLLMLVPIIIMVTTMFTLVIFVVNWIANIQRLPEFGILQALGHNKNWLVTRLTMETATLIITGWWIGIGLAWLTLTLLSVSIFAPRGQDLSIPILLWAVVLTIPVPIAVIGFTLLGVKRILTRVDPVSIAEQGERSQEDKPKPSSLASKSSLKPLTPGIFYTRHRKQTILLIGATSLMIMAVVLTIFLLAVSFDAQETGLGYLQRMSIVRASGLAGGLDPATVAQLKTHPAVERVISVAPRFHMLSVSIPPFVNAEASPFGVYAEDMEVLTELYGLELKEGSLPLPHTNEMVISEIVAQNRNLKIGDVIGDPENFVYPGAEALPVEFVVAGIFSRPQTAADENWMGFVSLEFLESHEAFPIPDIPPLIVVPKVGQKDTLDDWLETELSQDRNVSVLTYRQEIDRLQRSARNQMLQMALLESVIVIVASISLAVLNNIFTSQRKAEFGVLHALGYGRLQLVGRTLSETLFTTGIAWIFSALFCVLGLLLLQVGLFSPLGLKLNFVNLTPWLFTLPIPVLVIVVTTSTTARTLSKLDPVSIIERR